MSEPSHLPDDVRQWPSDPYAVLGIERNADFRTLRRAYAALIRVFKPEHAPEKFRRIRDAYELLQHFIADERSDSSEADSWGQGSEAAEATETSLGPSFAGPIPSAQNAVESAWKQARQGDLQEAYRRLVALQKGAPAGEEVYVRLYWLLTLWPNLDPHQTAASWLLAGIQRLGPRGRLLELCHSEWEHNPAEAQETHWTSVLECAGPESRVSGLTIARWACLPSEQRASQILADVERLEPRLEHDEDSWARLLASAIDYLAWDETDGSSAVVDSLWKRLESRAGENRLLDRYDLLFELKQDIQKLKTVRGFARSFAEAFCAAAPDFWRLPIGSVRPRILDLVAPLVDNVRHGLAVLDRVNDKAPSVLHFLTMLVDSLYHTSSAAWAGRDQAHLRNEVNSLLAELPALTITGYSDRLIVLLSCLREGITIEELGRLLFESSHAENRYLVIAQNLSTDASIRCLCKACLAFWN